MNVFSVCELQSASQFRFFQEWPMVAVQIHFLIQTYGCRGSRYLFLLGIRTAIDVFLFWAHGISKQGMGTQPFYGHFSFDIISRIIYIYMFVTAAEHFDGWITRKFS